MKRDVLRLPIADETGSETESCIVTTSPYIQTTSVTRLTVGCRLQARVRWMFKSKDDAICSGDPRSVELRRRRVKLAEHLQERWRASRGGVWVICAVEYVVHASLRVRCAARWKHSRVLPANDTSGDA